MLNTMVNMRACVSMHAPMEIPPFTKYNNFHLCQYYLFRVRLHMAFLSSRQTAAYRIRLQHIHFAFSISLSWLLYLVMENKREAFKMLMQLKMYTNSSSPIHKYIYIFKKNLCIIYSFGYLFFSVLFGLTLDDGLGILVEYVWGQEGKNVASLKCFAHRFLFMHTCNVICGCSFFMHNAVNN